MDRRYRRKLLAHAKHILTKEYTTEDLPQVFNSYVEMRELAKQVVQCNAVDKETCFKYGQKLAELKGWLAELETKNGE
jgi:hypothetical protein